MSEKFTVSGFNQILTFLNNNHHPVDNILSFAMKFQNENNSTIQFVAVRYESNYNLDNLQFLVGRIVVAAVKFRFVELESY